MRQVPIKTRRIEDGLVELSVLYDPTHTRLRTIRDAGRSLTRTKTSLFTSVDFVENENKQWRFFAAMNPNGSPPVVLSNIALFRVWAERLTGAICCIDMEGFREEPAKKRPTPKNRARSK